MTEVFSVAIICSLVNFLLVLLIFPESLSEESRARAVFEHSGEGKGKSRAIVINVDEGGVVMDSADGGVGASGGGSGQGGTGGGGEERGIIKAFLSPLAVFLPVVIMEGSRKRTDWSLTLLAGALFAYMLSTVSKTITQTTPCWVNIHFLGGNRV